MSSEDFFSRVNEKPRLFDEVLTLSIERALVLTDILHWVFPGRILGLHTFIMTAGSDAKFRGNRQFGPLYNSALSTQPQYIVYSKR